MNSLLPYLLPLLGILFLIIRRTPKSSSSTTERPDFINIASESIHGPEILSSPQTSNDNSEYNYDVVGESFQ